MAVTVSERGERKSEREGKQTVLTEDGITQETGEVFGHAIDTIFYGRFGPSFIEYKYDTMNYRIT
jgi:hypothetical protein